MPKPSSVHPSAEREIAHEAGYYERRGVGLGVSFLDSFDAALGRACDRPAAWSVVAVVRGEVVRATRLKRFPFRLIYVERTTVIRVLAVAHDKRRPLYWARRLRS